MDRQTGALEIPEILENYENTTSYRNNRNNRNSNSNTKSDGPRIRGTGNTRNTRKF